MEEPVTISIYEWSWGASQWGDNRGELRGLREGEGKKWDRRATGCLVGWVIYDE